MVVVPQNADYATDPREQANSQNPQPSIIFLPFSQPPPRNRETRETRTSITFQSHPRILRSNGQDGPALATWAQAANPGLSNVSGPAAMAPPVASGARSGQALGPWGPLGSWSLGGFVWWVRKGDLAPSVGSSGVRQGMACELALDGWNEIRKKGGFHNFEIK